MTSKADWLALAERCEKAMEPDCQLDLQLVSAAIGERWQLGTDTVPRYTASLDAITALIERELPNVTGIIPLTSGDEAWLWPKNGNPKGWRCNAATPALALCAAFCRAMAEAAE